MFPATDPWPVSQYPPLNPHEFQDSAAFSKLQKSHQELLDEAKSDEDVSVRWVYALARDKFEIPVLIYESRAQTTSSSLRPLFFVSHGGGWISGDFSVEDSMCRGVAKELDCLVASVHYRLSPAHQFPVPLHDCVDALYSIIDRNDELLIDVSKVILGGSSAGASLAAGVFQTAQAEKNLAINGLLLNIPVTCDPLHFPSQYSNESWKECADAPILSSRSMSFCFDQYFPSRAREPLVSPLISPQLDQFPPCGKVRVTSQWKLGPEVLTATWTVILCAERDPLRDQGLALAHALREKGRKVVSKMYKGVPHGFHMFPERLMARKAIRDMVEGVRWMLEVRDTGL